MKSKHNNVDNNIKNVDHLHLIICVPKTTEQRYDQT